MALVPRAIKEENRMAFGFSFNRTIGFVMVMMMSVSIGDMYVHSYLRVPFSIYCVVMFIIMNLKAPQNPKRRVWEGFVLWLVSRFSPNKYLSLIGYAFKEAHDGKQN
jgi:hypothetical protein